ncbi:MAG: sugar-binding domain-containing protein [Chitinophagaceae bacterium]
MKINSRRRFLRNAGLGLTGFSILPIFHGAKGAAIVEDDNFPPGEGTEAIEDDVTQFIKGKSGNPFLRNQVEDLSLRQHAKNFEEGNYLLQNEHIARAVDWKTGFVKTKSIKNKFTGESYEVDGEEFNLHVEGITQPLTTKDFAVKKGVVVTMDGKTQIVLNLNSNKIPDLNIKLIYELKDADFFGRKWLVLEPNPHTEFGITTVTVESLTFASKVNCSHQGNGQPVYIDNLFMGLEWPTADNSFEAGKYTATHWPAWNVGKATMSKIAVWGATPENEVSNWFLEKYVPAIRGSAAKPILVNNTWFDSTGASLKDYASTLKGYRKELFSKYGIELESFVIDDGWQNHQSIYEPLSIKGFEELQKGIVDILPGCQMGLWLPISCAGPAGDRVWGLKNGYEVTIMPKNYGGVDYYSYCLLGNKYTTTFKSRVDYIMKDLKVNYFKHDFNPGRCATPGHGHRITSGSDLESQTEGRFFWMGYMKAINPDIYLNYTSGMNLSPWWLMGADCIWFGGSDFEGIGTGPGRERVITYRDRQMYFDFVTKKNQFPTNAIMTHGIIKGNFCMNWKTPIEDWEHDVLMYFARGIMMWELYLTPELLTEKEWAFLAKIIKWAKKNAGVLSHNTRFLLGDPAKGEPYGYAHSNDNKCIVFLRNPGENNDNHLLVNKNFKVKYTDVRADIADTFMDKNFDDSSWETVTLPRTNWRGIYETKYVAYRHSMRIPGDWKGKDVRFMFEGIQGNCIIYFNGKKVATHNDWQEPFEVKLSKLINYDIENSLAIFVEKNKEERVGIFMEVYIGPRDVTAKPVSFTISEKTCGFDKKYSAAKVVWSYPENKKTQPSFKIGEPWEITMDPYELRVLELALS